MAANLPRVTLIHNQSAGKRDHDRCDLVAAITGAGCDVAYFDAKKCDIPQVLEEPADLIAAAGGDGTVRKVAAIATFGGTPLAILPLGRANNIAKSLRIVAKPQELITGWERAGRQKFFPIAAQTPWGRERLIEGFGFGALAAAIRELRGADLGPADARRRIAGLVLRSEADDVGLRLDHTPRCGRVA